MPIGKSRAFADRAADLGLGYTPKSSAPGLPGVLFRAADKSQVRDVVDAMHTPVPFVSGILTGVYVSDGMAAAAVSASYLAVPLPRSFGEIVLVPKRGGVLRRAWIRVGEDSLDLEADVTRQFTVYASAATTDGRRLARDLARLVSHSPDVSDVELVDRWALLYGSSRGQLEEGVLERRMQLAADVHRAAAAYDTVSAGPPRAERTVSPEEFAAAREAAARRRPSFRVTGSKVVQVLLAAAVVGTLACYVAFRI